MNLVKIFRSALSTVENLGREYLITEYRNFATFYDKFDFPQEHFNSSKTKFIKELVIDYSVSFSEKELWQ